MKHFLLYLIFISVGMITSASNTGRNKLSPTDQPITNFEAPRQITHKQYLDQLKTYDINLLSIVGFDTIDMRGRDKIGTPLYRVLKINKKYVLGLENARRSVLILFPEIQGGENILRQGEYIENEIRTNNRDLNLDIRPEINIIAREDMKEFAFADTAVIYELDFMYNDVPYLNAYRHCIGIYLRKYAHPALVLKIMLTDEGYVKKENYIRMLLRNIQYGTNPAPALIELEERQKDHHDLDFPSEKKEKPGIILNIDDETLDMYVRYKQLRDRNKAASDSIKASQKNSSN